ncbi:MAG: aldolase [Bryobacterales bacterium]|nr:aldolase [Acidobacteriota bacterium]MCB9385727.1 aldolase [Bryobacterales bacterium]
MRPNRAKQMLQEGKVVLGTAQNAIATVEVAKMAAAAGLDWFFLDTEHGPFTSETVHNILQACLATPITPIVRVADFQYDLVARTLDSGAEGIMFPRTESPEKLAEAISWAKFPPQGVRGFGLGPPQIGYKTATLDEIREHQNRETLVVAQIESVRGLEAIDEIVQVEGLDALLLGPADMSISLGVAGDWDSPKLWAAIDRVIEACNGAGRFPSIHVRNPEFAVKAIKQGMKLVSCGADSALLWGAVSGLAKALQAGR